MKNASARQCGLPRNQKLTTAFIALVIVATPSVSATPGEGEVRGAMVSMFASLRKVLVASSSFDDARTRTDPAVSAAITTIQQNARLAEKHFEARDSDGAFFVRRVERFAGSLSHHYNNQSYERAAHAVRNLVDSCMFCHVRLPDRTDSLISRGFLSGEDLEGLPLLVKARALAAARQFDASSTAWEEAFATMPAQAFPHFQDDLVDYLVVRVRVKEDMVRPAAVVRKLSKKKGLHKADKAVLKSWAKALDRTNRHGVLAGDDLERCKVQESKASELGATYGDERGIVWAVLASASCYHAASPRQPALRRAQAYFYLAEAEKRILGARDPDLIEDRLEHAIRLAPHTEIAERSYDNLEQWVVVQNSGSGGIHIPEGIRERLRGLKALARRPEKD